MRTVKGEGEGRGGRGEGRGERGEGRGGRGEGGESSHQGDFREIAYVLSVSCSL